MAQAMVRNGKFQDYGYGMCDLQELLSESKEFWMMVLLQAVKDLDGAHVRNDYDEGLNRRSARTWFDRNDWDCFNSFVCVCDALGKDPDKLRGLLRKSPKERQAFIKEFDTSKNYALTMQDMALIDSLWGSD